MSETAPASNPQKQQFYDALFFDEQGFVTPVCRMSLVEQLTLLSVAASVVQDFDDTDTMTYAFNKFYFPNSFAYTLFYQTICMLSEKPVIIMPGGYGGDNVHYKSYWVKKHETSYFESELLVTLDPYVKKYLLQKISAFMYQDPLDAQEPIDIDAKYLSRFWDVAGEFTLPLYEILKTEFCLGNPVYKISIKSLRWMLRLQDDLLEYADFRERVLKRAQHETAFYGDIIFEFEEIGPDGQTYPLKLTETPPGEVAELEFTIEYGSYFIDIPQQSFNVQFSDWMLYVLKDKKNKINIRDIRVLCALLERIEPQNKIEAFNRDELIRDSELKCTEQAFDDSFKKLLDLKIILKPNDDYYFDTDYIEAKRMPFAIGSPQQPPVPEAEAAPEKKRRGRKKAEVIQLPSAPPEA